MVILMDARSLHQKIREEVKMSVRKLEEEGVTAGFATIILNDDPIEHETQKKFVNFKGSDCRYCDIYFKCYDLSDIPMNNREEKAIELIKKLNVADEISGMIVQKPIPGLINESRVINCIDPSKDVDGLTSDNKKLLLSDYDFSKDLLPCTAVGIIELLDYYGVNAKGMDAVVVGRSELVGRPISIMLQDRDATVTCLHSKSKNKLKKIFTADLIVSAVGRPPELYEENNWRITGDMVKDGCVVIGVGGKFDQKTKKWYFDIDFDSVAEKASYITPNFNGIGLMTRARLLKNIVIATRMLVKKVKA